MQNQFSIRVALSLLFLALAPASRAVPLLSLVAGKGDPVFGNATLDLAGPPAIDAAGDVAFRAIVTGTSRSAGIDGRNDSAILLYSATGSIVTVARAGSADPVTGGTFSRLSDPALSGSGAIAYLGTLQPGTGGATSRSDLGVYTDVNAATSLVARTSGSAPGLETFKSFSRIGVDDAGGVSILANVSDAKSSPALYLSDTGGGLELVTSRGATFTLNGVTTPVTSIRAFVTLPFVGGQGRTLDPSGFAIAEVYGPYNRTGIAAAIPGAETSAVDLINVKSVGEPIGNRSENFAFLAKFDGPGTNSRNDIGIVAALSGSAHIITTTDSPAPNASGALSAAVFSKLSNPVFNQHNATAFVGTLLANRYAGVTSSSAEGIWSNASGTLKNIVLAGDPAPGTTGTFASFPQMVLPDVGDVIFEASLRDVPSAERAGVWAASSSGLTLIVATGQTLDFHGTPKTVKKIAIFQAARYVEGQSRSFEATTGNLVFQVTFTDNTWGIYKTTAP